MKKLKEPKAPAHQELFLSNHMYQEVILTVRDTAEAEQLIAELMMLGYDGVEERESMLAAYIAKATYDAGAVQELANRHNASLTVNEIPDQNWNEVWENNYKPVQVGNFAGIRAQFHQPLADVKFELLITPKMSFGTGHHATTYMMLDWMREFEFSGKTVLDMGTGTGVLAIMAEKLGASRIIAIDIDDWSIENAKENIEANGCHRIQLLQSDKLNTSELYDVILANINLNVILELLPAFRNHLSHSGLLILSGLLTDDESRVKAAGIETGIDFIAQKEKNNWLSMTFKK